MKKTAFLFFCLSASAYAQAQSPDFSNDGPRHTISINTVAPKWLQVETGLSKSSDNYSSPYKILLFENPSLLMRYGLSERLELRLTTDVITEKEEDVTGAQVQTGMRSIKIGGKLHVLKQKAVRPAVSIMAYYRINDLRFLRLRYDSINGGGFRLAFQNKLNEKWFLDYNVGMDWLSFRNNSERYTYSLSPVFVINESWKTYLEASGFIWNDVPPIHFLKLGVGYQFNQNSSVNIFGGKSWNTKDALKAEVYPKSHIAILFCFKFKTAGSAQ